MSVKCVLLLCLSLVTVTACAHPEVQPIQGRGGQNSPAAGSTALLYGGAGDNVGNLNPPVSGLMMSEASADPAH